MQVSQYKKVIKMSKDLVWVFGYGSLVWKVGFEHVKRLEGYIEGYKRR